MTKFLWNSTKNYIITFLIIICLFPLIVRPAYSVGLSDITEWRESFNQKVAEIIEKPVQNITDEIFEGVGRDFSSIINSFSDAIVNGITGSFAPTVNAFSEWTEGHDPGIMGSSAKSELNNSSGDYSHRSASLNMMIDLATWVGVFSSTIIAIFCLYLCMFGNRLSGIKDTPVQILVRYLLSLFAIRIAPYIMYQMMNIGNTIWVKYVMSAASTAESTVSYDDFNFLGFDGNVIRICGIALSNTEVLTQACILAILPIIGFILALPILSGFIGMFIEIAERYIVLIILYAFFPAAVGTFVSKSTVVVFKSYLKMFASQMFLILVNGIFMKVLVMSLLSGAAMAGIMGYIFTLAFIKCCRKMDSYMKAMGLSVAQTGGAVGNALGSAFRNLAMASRLATGSAETAGKALTKMGAALGGAAGVNLAKAGETIKDPVAAFAGGNTGEAQTKAAFSDMGAVGKTAPAISPEFARNVVSDAVSSPTRENANAYKGMDGVSRKDGIQSIVRAAMPNMGNISNVDDSNLSRGLKFSADLQDANGTKVKGGTKANFTLSGNESEGAKKVSVNGQDMYLKMNGNDMTVGDSISRTSGAHKMTKTEAAELNTKQGVESHVAGESVNGIGSKAMFDATGTSAILSNSGYNDHAIRKSEGKDGVKGDKSKAIESMTKTDNGGYVCLNKAGNQVGYIDTKEGKYFESGLAHAGSKMPVGETKADTHMGARINGAKAGEVKEITTPVDKLRKDGFNTAIGSMQNRDYAKLGAELAKANGFKNVSINPSTVKKGKGAGMYTAEAKCTNIKGQSTLKKVDLCNVGETKGGSKLRGNAVTIGTNLNSNGMARSRVSAAFAGDYREPGRNNTEDMVVNALLGNDRPHSQSSPEVVDYGDGDLGQSTDTSSEGDIEPLPDSEGQETIADDGYAVEDDYPSSYEDEDTQEDTNSSGTIFETEYISGDELAPLEEDEPLGGYDEDDDYDVSDDDSNFTSEDHSVGYLDIE